MRSQVSRAGLTPEIREPGASAAKARSQVEEAVGDALVMVRMKDLSHHGRQLVRVLGTGEERVSERNRAAGGRYTRAVKASYSRHRQRSITAACALSH